MLVLWVDYVCLVILASWMELQLVGLGVPGPSMQGLPC